MSAPARHPEAAIGTADAAAVVLALERMGLLGADVAVAPVPLAGGVSSDVYRVDLPGEPVCVKRALPKLKVAADWRAPVERNHWEVEWMRVAGSIAPDAVPRILGEDRETGCFAMAFLAPERHPVWKTQLAAGTIDVRAAAAVGDVLGRIHSATAGRREIAARFPTDDIFEAIRIEPYLLATARAHADLAARLNALAATTRATKRVLVHGDYSPKNLLIGPHGPVIVDAECAWFGDPAFDLAFVLNHLLLKGAWRPQWRDLYAKGFLAMVSAYMPHVDWEEADGLDARTAALLPGLMLARIDGKSPVEYLTDDASKDAVRGFARGALVDPAPRVADLCARWTRGSR